MTKTQKDIGIEVVGFVDAVITVTVINLGDEFICENKEEGHYVTGESWSPDKCIWYQKPQKVGSVHSVTEFMIEIRMVPQDVREIIRCINLYREYKIGNKFIVAYNFELTDAEVKLLKNHDILPIKLGNGFDKWCLEQITKKPEQLLEF